MILAVGPAEPPTDAANSMVTLVDGVAGLVRVPMDLLGLDLRISPIRDDSANTSPTTPPPFNQIELTDGWSCVRASLDPALHELRRAGRLRAGRKLRVTGASLQSPGPGDPLQAAQASYLCLTINGTHRGVWEGGASRGLSNACLVTSEALLRRTVW